MLRSSSLADLNSRHHSPLPRQTQLEPHVLPKENLNYRNFTNILKDYPYCEDTLEKTKKKRVILKSRQKFPSDFFNENPDTLEPQESQRLHLRSETSKPIKAKRSNSIATDSTPPTKTPKFSSGMSIFSNARCTDKNSQNDIQATSSKLLTEEYEDVFLPSEFPAANFYKLARSQSLVYQSGVKTDPLKIPMQAHEFGHGLSGDNYSRIDTETQQTATDIEASSIEKKGIFRSKSLNKRRMSSFSGFQNALGIERLRSEANLSGYRDNDSQLSTDISRKIFSREAQRNYSEKILETSIYELEPYSRARTPEKVLVNLPLIKKDVNKLDLGRLSRQMVVPLSSRESENIQTERPYYRVGSSYCSATKPLNGPPRIQSQGGKLECFGRRETLKAAISYMKNGQKIESPQTIFSTKTMAKFHNSIIKALNQNIPGQDNKEENDVGKVEDGLQKQDNKGEIVMETRNENIPRQNECVLKEKRDPCEFSFSKNFYKDKGLGALCPSLQNSIKYPSDQVKIGRKLREPTQEYLKSKSKIYVDSDIKKKFSIVRIKQLQS